MAKKLQIAAVNEGKAALDEGDTLVSCAVIPGDVIDEEAARAAAALAKQAAETPVVSPAPEIEPETELE